MAAISERAIEMVRNEATSNAMAPASLDSLVNPGDASAQS